MEWPESVLGQIRAKAGIVYRLFDKPSDMLIAEPFIHRVRPR